MNEQKTIKESDKKEIKEKLKGFFSKFKGVGRFVSKNKKNIIVCSSIVVICGVIYVNYALFGPSVPPKDDTGVENSPVSETDDYFSSAVLSREKARAEAQQVLKSVVDSEDALEEVKNEAYTGINTIAKEIVCESNIEQMMIAKGFEQCLAVVNDGSASIIVKSDGLLTSEIAQIKEIVYTQAGIEPKNIKIIEKT